MTEVDIRTASPDDAVDIAAVHVGSFVATYPHFPATHRSASTGLAGTVTVWDRLLARPQPGRSTLVATDNGGVCGFVHLGPSPDGDPDATGHIFSIHVSPELTGQGVGGLLMSEAVASLTGAGFRSASLWVVADNLAARRFYERLGWVEEGPSRREVLAVGDEEGDEVEVVRYRLDLGNDA